MELCNRNSCHARFNSDAAIPIAKQFALLSSFFPSLINTHSVMAKVLDCSLKVCKFELRSCYYVHFPTNLGGDIEPHGPGDLGSITSRVIPKTKKNGT